MAKRNRKPSLASEGDNFDISNQKMNPQRRITGNVLTILSMVFAAAIVAPLLWVLFSVFERGVDALVFPDIFTKLPPPPGLAEGGFGHAIVGTLMVLGVAISIAVPVGVLAAIYLAEFGRGTRLAYFVKFSANVLSGIPAIMCGLFAYSIVVRRFGSFSAFSGGVALAVLMLPYIIRATEEALLLVPNEMRLAARGIGATQFQTITQIVLPAALTSIVTGVVLATARAAGEAAPLLFTAFNNTYWSTSVWEPTATMPVLIYFFSIMPYQASQSLAWAASLVLLAMVMTFSILARLLTRKKKF
ncbi:phosphate ABC transporter permease PstA [Euhalothece natronophila Z-M001]|uniref:Phosphate transport system permease protein PstA n=1 Tax=Euhalothece natronophila Z-M001 TaxID=522448 RepID=A0A5B8NN55_9CHRO|nr:phosphate ABC transporter permease PstA [Euhalothece natronophila]QDZ40464.1 phosphate ABC transporter permease PstA [Euhalothece natronophila Z-M001]